MTVQHTAVCPSKSGTKQNTKEQQYSDPYIYIDRHIYTIVTIT